MLRVEGFEKLLALCGPPFEHWTVLTHFASCSCEQILSKFVLAGPLGYRCTRAHQSRQGCLDTTYVSGVVSGGLWAPRPFSDRAPAEEPCPEDSFA
eukprot:s3565_g6.t1